MGALTGAIRAEYIREYTEEGCYPSRLSGFAARFCGMRLFYSCRKINRRNPVFPRTLSTICGLKPSRPFHLPSRSHVSNWPALSAQRPRECGGPSTSHRAFCSAHCA